MQSIECTKNIKTVHVIFIKFQLLTSYHENNTQHFCVDWNHNVEWIFLARSPLLRRELTSRERERANANQSNRDKYRIFQWIIIIQKTRHERRSKKINRTNTTAWCCRIRVNLLSHTEYLWANDESAKVFVCTWSCFFTRTQHIGHTHIHEHLHAHTHTSSNDVCFAVQHSS